MTEISTALRSVELDVSVPAWQFPWWQWLCFLLTVPVVG
jgi:hypothetical protein